MTTDAFATLQLSPDQGREDKTETSRSARWRPEPPGRGPARWLRAIAGVKEDILDWAPEERPRYTRLGAIILNTGLLAGLSLFVALGSVVHVFWPLLVPIAGFWAYVIISFDSWLISSTHGALTANRFRMFVPRLVISVLIGAVIAEPLLLWVFQPAIHKEVHDYRQKELSAYAGQWKVCNPDSGQLVQTPACSDFHLSIEGSPQSIEAERAKVQAQRVELKGQIDDVNKRLAEMNGLAHDECVGRPGRGLTGVPGEGHNCLRDRKEADQFRVDSHLDARQAELAGMDQEIVELTARVQQASQTYGQKVSEAIAAKVAEKRAGQGAIGLLDEDAALERLSDRSGFVLAAQWLLRLLLIALDCLPVFVKLMGGTTHYDRFVYAQLELDQELHGRYLRHQDRRNEDEARADVERFDGAERAARARRQSDQRAAIDELADRLYRRGRTGWRPDVGRFPDQRRAAEGGGLADARVNGSHRLDEADRV